MQVNMLSTFQAAEMKDAKNNGWALICMIDTCWDGRADDCHDKSFDHPHRETSLDPIPSADRTVSH